MITFVMLTRLSADALRSPRSFEELEREVRERIRSECPQIEWVHNLAILGPYDYLDIFRAPDTDTAFKAASIIRTFGHAYTEIWTATEWQRFKEMVRNIPASK
jgi:uncharacterized protein with GYD domain